jgi:hypothetical protein
MVGVSEGLDLSNLDYISEEEINKSLMHVWSWRGPLYEMYATSLMLDYAPAYAKLARWGADLFGRPKLENVILMSIQNIHTYIMLGWETGIRNEFNTLRRNGMPLNQLMELTMFTQLYAGMRGLGHVYHAVGDFLAMWAPPPTTAPWPEGWAPDREAFKAGLDMTTRQLTEQDQKNITEWFEKTIGYLPDSYLFGFKHQPQFIKVNRARWENPIKTLPKQVAPYLMLRHHTIQGDREGLREAALLGRAWGMTDKLIVHGICCTAMYFTGFEGLYAAHDAVGDLLS